MPSPHTIERQRGAKEAREQLAVLREKWPLAFPDRDARPLALGTVGQIAEAMGWSIPYTIGAAKQAVAAKAKPKTKTKPAPETPAQLRARVRAGLLRRPTPPVRKLRG